LYHVYNHIPISITKRTSHKFKGILPKIVGEVREVGAVLQKNGVPVRLISGEIPKRSAEERQSVYGKKREITVVFLQKNF